MKLNDLKISTLLRLGLGIILALVVGLGALSWIQTNQLWLQIKKLYDHPFTVSRAVGQMASDAEKLSRHMRTLLLARNDEEAAESLRRIELDKADAERQIDIMYDRYLGPRDDLNLLRADFARWNALRDETIRLIKAGNIAEATDRLSSGGVQNAQGLVVRSRIRTIGDFAGAEGEELYRNATQVNDTLKFHLGRAIAAILLLSLSVAWLLLRGIRKPLAELKGVAEQFRQGHFDTRSRYVSANEFGSLAMAFNALAETIQKEMAFQERMARLNAVMLREIEARVFRSQVLAPLIQITGSQAGAIYLLNDAKTDYEHLESIGLGSSGRESFSAAGREGEFGIALTTRRVQRITAIPPDTRFTFATVSGTFIPREIMTIPLPSDEEVPAMISLASLHGYDAEAVRLVTEMQAALVIWMNSMLANRRIQVLTEDLEQRNRNLQEQREELRVANEELEEQARRLEESEEELKGQQEELQVTNEELEEKNALLERQKTEVEQARKQIEEKVGELALASKYKSEFLANMSHELRTPLNSLLLLAQSLSQNRDGNLTADQVESARIIYGSGSDLLTLINEILDLSKIEAGRIDLQLGAVRIGDLAEGVREYFQHLADEKGIGLEIVVTDDAPTEINSDRKRVDQVVRNLVSNAIKFTETGSVTVTFSRPARSAKLSANGLANGEGLAIAVKDTGIGIAPEQHKIIFEAFRQADGSTSRKYGGTGLGLSISRELAILLGGEIQLASAPGNGSTFTLYLPLARETRRQKIATLATNGVRLATNGEEESSSPQVPDDRDHIGASDQAMLVIEDDPDFARMLYDKCHERGFQCLVAPTGELGLELARRQPPRAVILDLNLPGMDGWGVLSALKADIRTRHIPVHIVSIEEPSTTSLRRGAVGHLTKPVNQKDLEEAFRKLEQMATGQPKRLLVVDDDATVRGEIVKLIGNGDVKTDEAESGEQALAALRSGNYDCVVLDLGLPDMDGGELFARLEGEGVAIPPVVVYTARDLTQDQETSLREHAEAIVIKDVRSQERLLDEVSLFLHRVVSQMPETKRKVILDLHDTDRFLKGKKILVVDDDMRTTFAVSRLLAEAGMQPLKAANGEKALRLLEAQPDVDLVLMDIMMPVMDGYETMRRIRAQDRFRNLPIIALTAKAMSEDREKCLVAGANDYLSKPLEQGRLFSMMRIWLCR